MMREREEKECWACQDYLMLHLVFAPNYNRGSGVRERESLAAGHAKQTKNKKKQKTANTPKDGSTFSL